MLKSRFSPALAGFFLLGIPAFTACNKNTEAAAPSAPAMVVTVSTVAGSGVAGAADGAGTAAQFHWPYGIVQNAQGTLYVADNSNNAIRQVSPAGVVSTLAYVGGPSGLALDSQGMLYVGSEGNGPLTKVSPSGAVSSLPGAAATHIFHYPRGLAIDAQGTLYVGELAGRILKVSPAGVVTVLAGDSTGGYVNGVSAAARFSGVQSLAVDAQGTLYVGDADNARIRKVSPAGVVTTLAGSGITGGADGVGPTAQFGTLYGLMVDAKGTLYAADGTTVRRILANGEVKTLAGDNNQAGYVDGLGATARFSRVAGICGNAQTGFYITDFDNSRIRKLILQ